MREYLQDALYEFRKTKALADKAIAQVPEAKLFAALDGESNSIAVVMKHMAGNMRSRWTDFLTTDGEKPERHRDSEFVIESADSKEKLLADWEGGWSLVLNVVGLLGSDDLDRIVMIREEPHTVLQAINRQLTHYAYHVGQIVFLARHFASANWKSLSVPRGKSDEWNAAARNKRRGT